MSSNASIVVQFKSPTVEGDDPMAGSLSAEIDSREDGLNGKKTSFAPGDKIAILVFKSDNVEITRVECSAGSIAPGGDNGYTWAHRKDDLQFVDTDIATLAVPVAASEPTISWDWLGRSLGTLTLRADRRTVKASSKGVAVAKAWYYAKALVYILSTPANIGDEDDFSIVVLIAGEVKGAT